MPRPEKVQAVEEIKARMEEARAFFLTEYRGLSVKQQQTLRRALREAGGEYKVLKMSLAAIAARDLGHDEIAEELAGPTAIAFAGDDAVATAKALDEFAGDNEAFVLKVGMLSGNLLAPEQVSDLAKMPSREEILGKIAGAMAAPLQGAAGLFAAFTTNAANMFSQLLDKKESEGGDSAEADAAPADQDDEPAEEADASSAEEEAPAAEDSADAESADAESDDTESDDTESADAESDDDAEASTDTDAPSEDEASEEAADDEDSEEE